MKGKKTILWNVFWLLTALFEALAMSMPQLEGVIPPEAWPFVLAFVAVGNKLLRAITTTPIWKNE